MKAKALIDQGRRTIRDAADRFSATGDERHQATELLTYVLGHEPRDAEEVRDADRRRFERYVARRAKGEPIPYIVGWTEFRDLRIGVKPGVFVPRATTEFLA